MRVSPGRNLSRRRAIARGLFIFALVDLVVLNVAAAEWLGDVGGDGESRPASDTAPVAVKKKTPPERVGQVVLFFEEGQTDLTRKQLAHVARVLRVLGDASQLSAAVALHSHRPVTAEGKKRVIERRARAVLRCLVAVGFDGRNLRARDFGSRRPRVAGGGAKAAAQNRRAVINIFRGTR